MATQQGSLPKRGCKRVGVRQIKARIVVEGNVQGVGYRALVKQIARRMKVKGKIKNLDDGAVEIYCDTDKETFKKFKDVIEIKARNPEDVFALNVERIDVKFEGESGYISPGKELGPFEIDHGEEAESAFERANLERLEIGSLILIDVGEKVDKVGEKVDKVGRNVKTVGRNVINVGNKIDRGFSKTGSNFKDLDGKYDVVSKELKSMNKNISKLTGYVGTLVEEVVKKKGVKKGREG